VNAFNRWVARHRLVVGLVWLAITVVGVFVAPSVSGRLHGGVQSNSPAYTANQQLAAHYGGAGAPPGVLLVDLPAGETVTSPAVTAQLRAFDVQLAQHNVGLREISYAATGDKALVSTTGTGTIVLVYPPAAKGGLDAAALDQLAATATAAVPGASVHVTGLDALSAGNATSGSSSILTELLIGAVAALIILAWVFGSFLAVLPLIMAFISVLTMQLFIYGLSFLMPASTPFNPAVQYIVALLGLGLSMDYALLIVTRWREERAGGKTNEEAVAAAMHRAGHAVLVSGITASLGLFALIVVPATLVRGIGVAGLFIPATATLVAMTLLPVVLSKVGPRLDWPRHRSSGAPSRFWTWWSRGVIRHRVVATVVGLAILFGLAGVGITMNVAQPNAAALADTGTSAQGLRALQADGFPTGTLTPIPVLLPTAGQAPSVAASLSTLSSVHGAITPTGPGWQQQGSAVVMVLPTSEVGTSQPGTALADVRSTAPPGALVGGDGAQSVDQANAIYSGFPLLFALVAVVTFLLLARGLRSILLPVKAVLLNALSVGATYGLLVLVWQHGLGTHLLWGVSATGSVDTVVPMLLFGFLFGISMDYEVFILSRVREGYDRTGSTAKSIVEGVSRTGRLVTSAALILFFTFVSLATANDVTVRQLASGMAAGILLDAVVVRMLLLPALVSLFGNLNWWMPEKAQHLLRLPAPTAPAVEDPHILAAVGDA